MTTFQRLVAGVAAGAVAIRVFFPARYYGQYGLRTDLHTTLLHVSGVLAIAAALFFLVPSPNFGALHARLKHRLAEFREISPAVMVGLLFLVMMTMRVLYPVQLAPTNGRYALEFPLWSTERLLLTLGLFDASTIGPGWSAKPDWATTDLHFVGLLLAGGLLAWWRWPRGHRA